MGSARLAAYRAVMLARKAAAAGLPVEEFLRRGEIEAARVRRVNELRHDRDLQFRVLGRKALAHGRTMTRMGG